MALCLVVRADDAGAKTKLDKALSLYAQRGEAGKIDEAVAVLKDADKDATSAGLKYDLLVLYSRALYYKGTHTKGDKEKVQIHDLAYKVAESARTEGPDYAEALYWSAANLGRWAEANGVVSSLSKKKEIMATLEQIFELKTKGGQPGETYEGYGANRILGRLYFKLPGWAGGSTEKALKNLEITATKAPNFAINVWYYAETLSTKDKGKAKDLLRDLLTKDPKTLNADRVPETIEDFVEAKRILAELGG